MYVFSLFHLFFSFISGMVSQYRLLYLEIRTDTLEALDSMPQLKHVHNLKAKILFSIIVVSTFVYILLYTFNVLFINKNNLSMTCFALV